MSLFWKILLGGVTNLHHYLVLCKEDLVYETYVTNAIRVMLHINMQHRRLLGTCCVFDFLRQMPSVFFCDTARDEFLHFFVNIYQLRCSRVGAKLYRNEGRKQNHMERKRKEIL